MEDQSNKTQDIWMPFKKLEQIVRSTISRPSDTALLVLEDCLRKHKQNFLTLLKNPPKNATYREELNRGASAGIAIPGIGPQIVSKELVQESIIISDMYELNEYMALDLLCTAQMYMSHYPGLTRGLVAILLYYDGRNALVSTLRTLVQARSGVLWCTDASPDVVKCITRYTDQLLVDGLFNRIFELLNTLDVTKEVELLQKNRALGGPKHYRQVLDMFEQIRQSLADIVYMWSAQSRMPREPTMTLINYLKVAKLQDDASGGIDNITLTLQMALLYAVDLSMLQRTEDEDDSIKNLPLVADAGFISFLIDELAPEKSKWECEGLKALTLFAWGLSLATLRLSTFSSLSPRATEQADIQVDYAIQMRVFDFLHRIFLENKLIYSEKYYIRRLHILITDFIVLMHSKVKDLRLREDETARAIEAYTSDGIEVPANLPHYYQNLLLAIAKLYGNDTLNLKLNYDFWSGVDSLAPSRSTSRAISLFKFVIQAGELLPPTLFVPYLTMLSSLASGPQAARHTFNLLKQNGLGNVSMVSWDHFFNSLNQYYASLRHEVIPTTDIYPIRGHTKGITPLEIQGLHCVLKVIGAVATHDEFSRIALCEHPGWGPLNVLLGLVSCCMPIPLKAELLNTLAALTKSPETASQMWMNLEASQIIVTMTRTSSYEPRGVETELNEIESREEEYPLTRSLLKLMSVLISSGIPRALGAGSRQPGFDPYLKFIVNSVFIKFNTRQYKNPEEKWEVARLCLELFVKFLNQYDPQKSDFSTRGQANDVNPPPGFHIMLQLNSKSELLRLILFILHEGIQLLDTFAQFTGKKQLEDTTLLCLKLLDQSFQLQLKFFALVTSTGCPVILTKLNKLLLVMNPYSGKPDNLVNIAKYVTYNSWLREHALFAVKILLSVTSAVAVSNQFLGLLKGDERTGAEIMQGFVECLEAEDEEKNDENLDDVVNIRSSTKLMILRLLKQCISHNPPNLSHYFLGFNMKKDIRKTVFQRPRYMGLPSTCLHALYDLLNKYVTNKNDISTTNAAVIESAYSMLYVLCANPNTSEPVLRFIRTKHDFIKNHDFLESHIQALPLNSKCNAVTLNQVSWLLKIVAIEIKMSSESNNISQLTTLVKLFLGHSQKPVSGDTNIEKLHTPNEHSPNTPVNRLIALLNNLNLDTELLEVPKWNFFDDTLIERLLMSCEHIVGGIRLIDIKKLHRILMKELGTIQGGAAVSQKQLIVKEIESVLMYAIKYNNMKNNMSASIRFMDSWRQIAEILFISAPTEVLNLHSRQSLIVQILHSLLFLLIPAHVTTDLGNIISEATLMLFVCLRRAHLLERKQMFIQNPNNMSTNIPLLSSMVTLQHIIRKIVEWIIVSEVTAQKIRVHLYGALLHATNILSIQNAAPQSEIKDSLYVSRLDNSKYRQPRHPELEPQITLEGLSSFGEKLFDILCHDCTGGHDVAKMLSLATIDMMVEVDRNNEWINFLCIRGYLKHIIDSLMESDDKLREMLAPVPQNLRPLYLYESKMMALCRIAMSRLGAQALLEQKTFSCLATMRVFDYHPEIKQNVNSMDLDLIPPIDKRYQQILFPMLNLSDAILTSLGTENQSATIQIIHCLFSHAEMVEMILRSGSPSLGAGTLKELALVTGVIARTTNNNMSRLLAENDSLGDNTAFFNRVQKLMLALFPRFVLTDNVVRDVPFGYADREECNALEKPDRRLNCLQVACHLALFARNCIAGHGIEHRAPSVIFPPTLNESPTSDFRHQYGVAEQSPGLRVVVNQLLQSVKYYHKEKVTLDFLVTKISKIPTMNSSDLKDVVNVKDKSNIMDRRIKAHEQMSTQLSNKQKEMKYTTFLIENCLYLIWAHLDYYMIRAIPKSGFPRFRSTGQFNEGPLENATEVSWRVAFADIKNFAQSLVGVFDEKFSINLVATTQDQPEANRGFVEALLRRIKRLIQFVPIN